jgi:hypothetical protein
MVARQWLSGVVGGAEEGDPSQEFILSEGL